MHDRGILVVGGAGYIGSHVTKMLSKQGYKPVILDDLSTGHKAAAKYGPFYEGNCADSELVQKIVRSHSIGTVMHFGGKAIVSDSVRDPLVYYSSNVSETLSLLNTMKKIGVKHFVFSSTCSTFGEPDEVPIHEEVMQKPVNSYGWSKLFVERILKDMRAAYGFNSAILRYFNAAGADPDGELGEDHRNETHLIPLVLSAALGKSSKLTVYGNDYPTNDGSCVRDYIHVNDLAEAHIQAMELIWKQNSSFDFNLGSEHGHSVFEVIRAVEKVTGKKVKYEIGARRHGDPPALIADANKARKLLNWSTHFTLEQIVSTAAKWMEAHPNGYE